jgi:hypothetical protein
MARRPTKWEQKEINRKEENRKKERKAYEEAFIEQYQDNFNKLIEVSLLTAVRYVLKLIVLHLLSHDRTYMPPERSTCIHDMIF